MSKFLSGRQSNLKLGVAGYTESKTVLETTGKVGIGTTDAQSYSLFVVGPTNITGDTTVGSAITMYASTGIVSATAFYGDGSNLENTGATLSAAAGTQRLVVTSLTSGTMVDAATDSDLTYNATTDTLNVENIDVDGHTELDQLRVTGVSTFAGNVDISSNGNLTVAGNLIVQGTETRLNTTVLEVEDINIGIASVTPTLSDAALDGAGITIHGSQGDKTLTWSNANSRMEFNTDVNVANLELDDNQKAKFGTGDDLQIYHNGSNSYITDSGSGNLLIGSDNDLWITNAAGTENKARFTTNGGVNLYYDNSKKFETTGAGVTVSGTTQTQQLNVSGFSTFHAGRFAIDQYLGFGNPGSFGHGELRIRKRTNTQAIIQNETGDFVIDNQVSSSSNYIRLQGKNTAIEGRYGGQTIAKFVDGGASELNYNGTKKFETTSYGVKIYDDLEVGLGVTVYGNAGIVSATSFYGDGSNLTNTGATLSATSGVERLVTTQLTSGTMVDAATDADLTFDAGTNTLNTENLKVSGGISTDGSDYGQQFQLLRAQGNGKWEWATVPGIFSVNNILNGFNVLEEGGQVGTAGSIHTLDFRGINVTASADPQPNGIATITFSSTPTFDSVTVNDFIDLNGDLEVLGVSTFSSNVHVGSGITMYAATGIVSATKLYGDGSDLTGINAGVGTTGSVNTSGIITATSFHGDGSALTGISTFSGNFNDLTNAPTGIVTDSRGSSGQLLQHDGSTFVGIASTGFRDYVIDYGQGYYAYTTDYYTVGVANTTQEIEEGVWTLLMPQVASDGLYNHQPTPMQDANSGTPWIGAGVTIGTGQTEFSLAGLSSGAHCIVRSVFRFEPDTDETDLDMRLHFTTNTATQGTGLTNFNIQKQALVMTVGAATTYSSETLISFFVGETLSGLTTADAGSFCVEVNGTTDGTLEVLGLTVMVDV